MNLFAVQGMPSIRPGDDLAALIVQQLRAAGEKLLHGDIVVVAQKIVSKAEGRLVKLSEVQPGERAQELARITGKIRVVQVIWTTARRDPGGAGCSWWSRRAAGSAPTPAWTAAISRPKTASRCWRCSPRTRTPAPRAAPRFAELTGVTPAVLIIDSHAAWRIGTAASASAAQASRRCGTSAAARSLRLRVGEQRGNALRTNWPARPACSWAKATKAARGDRARYAPPAQAQPAPPSPSSAPQRRTFR